MAHRPPQVVYGEDPHGHRHPRGSHDGRVQTAVQDPLQVLLPFLPRKNEKRVIRDGPRYRHGTDREG